MIRGTSPIDRLKVAAGLLGLAGLFGIILYIVTDKGAVRIMGADSQMKISIDKEDVRIENPGKPITFRTGAHQLEAERDGLEFKTDSFQIRAARRPCWM